ncbi:MULTISPECIES: major capsid protein [Pseudomonas]|uniref:major capsid protein n=1 Tax=Pseudomonas TaxID=286 RepID=UPI0028A9A8B3|nr:MULTISPECIES: major capsid protein [Pseudomonas]
MKQLKALNTAARNLAIASVGTVMAVPAFAAIDISGVETELTSAGTNAGTVAGWVAVALVVLAGAGIIFGMLRKA